MLNTMSSWPNLSRHGRRSVFTTASFTLSCMGEMQYESWFSDYRYESLLLLQLDTVAIGNPPIHHTVPPM
jgi:hypothetical protein